MKSFANNLILITQICKSNQKNVDEEKSEEAINASRETDRRTFSEEAADWLKLVPAMNSAFPVDTIIIRASHKRRKLSVEE